MPPWRWGIFLRRPCAGLWLDEGSPDFSAMSAIYAALKDAGFRETYWQYVYPGQIGGLIKSPRSQLVEFHVRFFTGGMMYAELELGRSALLHFIGGRYYLNRYMLAKLKSRLTEGERTYLRGAFDRYKAHTRNEWPDWSGSNRFMTPPVKRQMRFFSLLSDWRTIALVIVASVFLIFVREAVFIPVAIAILALVYLMAPKRS